MSTPRVSPLHLAPLPRRYYSEPELVALDGASLAVRRGGTGHPVLFLHGASLTRMWLPFHERLAARVDLIAPELPGYGESPRCERIENLEDVVLLYEELLDHLGIERVHVVGWSLGGWLGALFAAAHRRRTASLTLITPSGLDVPDALPSSDLSDPDVLWNTLFNDPANLPDVKPDHSNPDEVAHLEREGETRVRLSHCVAAGSRLERRLGRVTCAALVIRAEHDRLIPDAVAERYAEVLPDARLASVPGTGHALLVEQPGRVAGLVTDFVGRRDFGGQ